MPAAARLGQPAALHDLVRRQRPEQSQQVDDALDVAGPAVGREPLQLELVLVDDVGVEQLAQLGPAEKLGSSVESSDSAAARRSARGESPSYMNAAT